LRHRYAQGLVFLGQQQPHRHRKTLDVCNGARRAGSALRVVGPGAYFLERLDGCQLLLVQQLQDRRADLLEVGVALRPCVVMGGRGTIHGRQRVLGRGLPGQKRLVEGDKRGLAFGPQVVQSSVALLDARLGLVQQRDDGGHLVGAQPQHPRDIQDASVLRHSRGGLGWRGRRVGRLAPGHAQGEG
jgi:hypothetical protein